MILQTFNKVFQVNIGTIHIKLFLISLILFLSACSDSKQVTSTSPDKAVLKAWAHSGQEGERIAIQNQVERFNSRNDEVEIQLTLIPEGSYNSQVQAAALAGELPDILEFDGPFIYNYVWQGHLKPIDAYVSEKVIENVIPSIIAQGTYRGKLYSLGMFDSGLGIYGRRSILEKVGARIPLSPEDAWTVDEFESILKSLAELDDDGAVIDLKLNYSGEWYTYAFSPFLQSAGADLIDRNTYEKADGTINSLEAISAMKHVQDWIVNNKFVDPNVDDNAFTGERVALSLVGHWEYRRYKEKFADDLIILPMPDFNLGSRTGQGSWNWGITEKCKNPSIAGSFLEFLLEDEQIIEMTDSNAAVPATKSSISKSSLYGEGSPLQLFSEQLSKGYSVPRPQTPAYPVITSVFQQAFDDIRSGADVEKALNKAAQTIDRDIKDNQGYPSN